MGIRLVFPLRILSRVLYIHVGFWVGGVFLLQVRSFSWAVHGFYCLFMMS